MKKLRTSFLVVGAFIAALVLNVAVYVHGLFNSAPQSLKLSLGEECTDDSQAPTTNPNKMLFISCGGFLE